jgi:hypothetical protein
MATYKEQMERINTIIKAKDMFPEERNITVALRKYKDVTGDPIEVMVSTRDYGNKPTSFMDDYERILCPECGADMLFRILPENEEGFKTRLECSNKTCKNAINSEYSIIEWMQVLKKKDNS